MLLRSKFPCKNCTKKYIGCHDKCSEYIEAQRKHHELKKKIDDENKTKHDLNSFRLEQVRKVTRSSR